MLSNKREKVKRNKGKSIYKIVKKFSPHFLYPYIGEYNRADRIESKMQVWINGQILSWETQPKVHNKLHHATLYLFRSHVKKKMVKHFCEGTTFNAHALHYILVKSKKRMSTDAWTAIPKGRPRLLKDSFNILNVRRILGTTVPCQPKAQ